MIVLDASALLAYFFQEPGADRVKSVLHTALIGAANFSEALTRVIRQGGDIDAAIAGFDILAIPIVPVTREHAIMAAKLHPLTKHAGLSLGDRLCLALAIEQDAPAMTTDRAWASLPHGANVVLIR